MEAVAQAEKEAMVRRNNTTVLSFRPLGEV